MLEPEDELPVVKNQSELERMLGDLKTEMKKAAKNLEFERAAQFRDKIKELSRMDIFRG